jgi:hypothetical protein
LASTKTRPAQLSSSSMSRARGCLPALTSRFTVLLAGLFVFVAYPGMAFADNRASVVSFEGPQPQVEFSGRASNGYSIFFEASRGKASLTAQSDAGTVIYGGKSLLASGRTRFGLGKLGRIDVRFNPDGSAEHLRPPKSCKGREQAVYSGHFVGTVRFRGEGGYTRFSARRVYGTVAAPRSWTCPDASGGRPENAAPLPSVLGAFTPHSQVVFAAISGSERPPFRFFVAGTSERREALNIKRSVSAKGKPVSFEVLDDLSSATVAPPKPFAGTASFVRNADGSTEWSGTLSVVLPGVRSIALAGPAFTADLEKPRTAEEFSEIIGLG